MGRKHCYVKSCCSIVENHLISTYNENDASIDLEDTDFIVAQGKGSSPLIKSTQLL